MGLFSLFGRKRLQPRRYDLRHFKWLTWSDTWDGSSVPDTGPYTRDLFYLGEKVYTHFQEYLSGTVISESEEGHKDFLFIDRLGQIYLALAKTAVRLGLYEEDKEGTTLDAQITEAEKAALQQHWQYQDLQEMLMDRGWRMSFRHYDDDLAELYMVVFEPEK